MSWTAFCLHATHYHLTLDREFTDQSFTFTQQPGLHAFQFDNCSTLHLRGLVGLQIISCEKRRKKLT